MKPKLKPKPQTTLTESKLAKMFSLDRRTVCKHLDAAGVVRIRGGYPAEPAIAALTPTSGSLTEKRKAEIARILAGTKRIELDMAIKRKEFIPTDEARRDATMAILGMKARLYDNIDSITAAAVMKLGLTDKQADTLREIVKADTIAALKLMARGEWGNVTCPACKAPIQ